MFLGGFSPSKKLGIELIFQENGSKKKNTVTFHSLVPTALGTCGKQPSLLSQWKKKNPELNAVSLGGAEGMQRVNRDVMSVFATRQFLEIGI